jgi:hypothetical protein
MPSLKWLRRDRDRMVDERRTRRSRIAELVKREKALTRGIARRNASIRKQTTPLRERAYQEALKLIGITEQGGNNRGPEVEKIIREGGGLPGQAWCGWLMAAVYKRAGSVSVSWQMGAVRLWLPLSGVRRVRKPKRGDAVRFTFDHIGMFEKDNGDGTITTIEGNTGSTGAVSDSANGKDGVKRKVRSKSLVNDYLRITR